MRPLLQVSYAAWSDAGPRLRDMLPGVAKPVGLLVPFGLGIGIGNRLQTQRPDGANSIIEYAARTGRETHAACDGVALQATTP